MPAIELTDDQVAELIEQLPYERRAGVLLSIVNTALASSDPQNESDWVAFREYCNVKELNPEILNQHECTGHFLEFLAAKPQHGRENCESGVADIINAGLRDLKDVQIRNRERAVQTIAQKNNLQNLVENEERLIEKLEKKAEVAKASGDLALLDELLREIEIRQSVLGQLLQSFLIAERAAEAVKNAVRKEEEFFRVKTAEALAFRANMGATLQNINSKVTLESVSNDAIDDELHRLEDRLESMRYRPKASDEQRTET